MFYKQHEINQELTCGICFEMYEDPRLLPCGVSACNKCIKKLAKDTWENEFECPFCKQKHKPTSSNGFPIIQALSNLVKIRANDVYRNQNVDKLKSKLADIRSKCDDFKYSLNNGVDKVKEYCILFRNQVHLQTDILIEEIHGFNEKLIGEINEYEQRCVESFNGKMKSYKKDIIKVLNEMDGFFEEKSKYLADFKIDDRKIAESLAKSDGYLQILKKEEETLKRINFGGRMLEFKKNQQKHNQSLLGSFIYKQLGFGAEIFKEMDLKNMSALNCESIYDIFKHDNGNTSVFYWAGIFYHVSAVTLDSDGALISETRNIFNDNPTVLKLDNKYMLHQDTNQLCSPFTYREHKTIDLRYGKTRFYNHILIITDDKLNYLNHKLFTYNILHMKANKSNILYIDGSKNYHYTNLDFNITGSVPGKSVENFKQHVGDTVVDFEMNDQNIFFLCNTNKLKIFDLKSFDLVKEIETNANQIKLASSDYIFLFDSKKRIVFQFNQSGDFAKVNEVNLAQSIDEGSRMSTTDKSKFISFIKSATIKYACLY